MIVEPHKMVVGLTGLPRSGKDTVADYLVQEYGFTKFAFADAVYEEVAEAFGVTVEQLRSVEWKTVAQEALAIVNCKDQNFHSVYWEQFTDGPRLSTHPNTSRKILQWWGTEYRRDTCGKDYWLREMALQIEEAGNPDRIVISDVRYDNEAAYCYALGNNLGAKWTSLLKVSRDSTNHTGHTSDDELSSHIISGYLDNNFSVGSLKDRVDRFMRF